MLSTAMEMTSASPPPLDLETLFRQHNRLVFRTAYRITGNSADAEDVLQTVFMRLSGKEMPAGALEHPESYLRRAATNASLDLLRQRRTASGDNDYWINSQMAPPGDMPEHQFWVQQAAGWLREAVAGLSPQAAEIFALRFFEDRGNAEIAEMVGSTVNSVAVTLHRSRERLREQFRQLLGGNHA